jgi:hypothetical protein
LPSAVNFFILYPVIPAPHPATHEASCGLVVLPITPAYRQDAPLVDGTVSDDHKTAVKMSLENRADTVGEPPSAEIRVSNMPALKAKKLGKLAKEKVLLEL